MKKRIAKIITLAISVVLILNMVGCVSQKPQTQVEPQKSQAPARTIIMGTNPEFPPFEYVNDKGEVDGFDVAMIKAIAKEMGAELKIESMEFKSLIGAMQTGKIDIIAAGMTVTDERKQSVNFTDSYYTAKQKVLVKVDNDKIKDTKALSGKNVGVQEGTTGDFLVSPEEDGRIADNVKVSRYKKGIDAVMDLKTGRLDAVVIDSNPAAEFVKKNPEVKILDIEIPEEQYAIAVNKNDATLLSDMNKALKTLKDNGTYAKLVEEYINK